MPALSKFLESEVLTDGRSYLWRTPYVCLGVKGCNAACFASFSQDVAIELEFKSKHASIVGKSVCEIFRGTLIELLKSKIESIKIENINQRLAIACLENFVTSSGGGETHLLCLKVLKKKLDDKVKIKEAEIQAVLACHLFSPLIPEGEVIVDSTCYGNKTASGSPDPECPICQQAVTTGNTNFGCRTLWHGRADIVIKTKDANNVVLIVPEAEPEDEEEGQGEPMSKRLKRDKDAGVDEEDGGKSTLKNSMKTCVVDGLVSKLLHEKGYKQAISQTIMNAFLAVKQNKSLESCLIPSFFATGRCIFINFYNVKNDILLVQSKPLFFIEDGKINFHTVISVWMALNFQKFKCCSTDGDKYYEKSGFKDRLVELNVLKNYEKEIEYGFSSAQKPEESQTRDFYVDATSTVKLLNGIITELKQQVK